jgi:hypothetical protein
VVVRTCAPSARWIGCWRGRSSGRLRHVARYARYKWDGTITNLLAYPLMRALYGLRIRQPIGGDFGISGDLVRHLLAQDDWTPDVSGFGVDAWMTTTAIAGGFAVCEARLGAKIHDPKDPRHWARCSAVVATAAAGHATDDRWLGVQGSRDTGLRLRARWIRRRSGGRRGAVEGVRAAPPSTAPRPRRSAGSWRGGQALAQKRRRPSPDRLWARVVYGAVLAHRHGVVPDEELIEALVPLYFGRVASHVRETAELSGDGAEAVVERQARAFESVKPEFVERWRAGS